MFFFAQIIFIMRFTILFIVYSILILPEIFSQNNSLFEKIYRLYPNESAVILNKKEQLNIDIVNGKLEIETQHYIDKLLLSEEAQGAADHDIYYSETFNEITDIDAQALFPVDNRYKSVAVKNISTESVLDYAIFYDDNIRKHISYPKLPKGGRSILNYRKQLNDPHLLGSFYFNSYLPTINVEYSVSIPNTVNIGYKIFNGDNKNIVFSKNDGKSKTIYSWKAENLEKYEMETDMPNIRFHEPHIVVYITDYKSNEKPVKIFSEIKDLYDWYKTFVSDINTESNEEIKKIIDSLITAGDNDREKIRKIFYWVQDNIKYVAFEEGISGFVPRSSAAICRKRYGDCKDMTNLLIDMLNMAAIPAHFAWIGTRDIPYHYNDIPTPHVDNHVIAAVKLNDDILFLDATGQFSPLGFPTSFIQGKEALIGIDNNNFEIKEVPVVPMEKNSYTDSVTITIDNNTLNGKGKLTATGYAKTNFSESLASRKPDKYKEVLTGWIEKGHNKFSLNSFEIQHLDNRDKPLITDYIFSIQDYIKKFNDEIYVNLHLDKLYYNGHIEKTRKLPIEYNYKFIEKHVTKLIIPDNYRIGILPDNAGYSNDQFGFTITYNHDGNTIIADKTIYHNTLLLEKPDFDTWNSMIDALNAAYNETLQLIKTR